jgi:apolipoprotein N-acyltransferase
MHLPKPLVKAWPIFASAAMLSLAFPPTDVILLVLVALAPWFASIRDTTPKGAFKSGYVLGVLFFLHQMFWIVPFVTKWTGKLGLAMVPWIVAALIAGLYYALAGVLVNRCWAANRPWLIPICWAAVEAFRAYIPGLAFPWGILATPLWRVPAFIQHSAFGTIFLVSAWLTLPSVLLAMWFWPGKDSKLAIPARPIWRMGGAFVALMLISVARYSMPPTTLKHVVTVTQPGVNQAFGSKEDAKRELAARTPEIIVAAMAQKAEILFLPEGFAYGGPDIPPDSPFGEKPPVAVVFGGNRFEGENRYQTAYGYDGKWSWANKTRLVIFGEYVPGRNFLPFLDKFNLPSGDLKESSELKTMDVKGIRIGALLCFEGLFPDLADKHCALGSQLLAVLAIDDWYEGTPAVPQLMSGSVWRSAESGLPVVRSASRGYTLATDCRANVISQAPWGEPTAMRVELGIPDKSDAFAGKFAFVWLCWAAALGVLVEPWVKRIFARYGARSVHKKT